MKLLYCTKCSDIFRLWTDVERACKCRESKGKYTNELDAYYSGPCVPLGFTNGSFVRALQAQPESGMGRDFTAFVIPKVCPTFTKK